MSTNNSLNLNTVTPLIVGYGGTGANNAASARTNLGAAASGANSDITSLTGLTGAVSTPSSLLVGNLELTANTISSTNTNGDIVFAPNGTGLTGVSAVSSSLFGRFQVLRITDGDNGITCGSFSNTMLNGANFLLYKSRSTVIGSHVALQNNDNIGVIAFLGDDGSTYNNNIAQIICGVSGSVSTGVVPGILAIHTTDISGVSNPVITLSNAQVATFANPIVTSGVNDTNGNKSVLFGSVASAVNYVAISNGSTGNSVSVAAQSGTDADVKLVLASKASGAVAINSLSSTPLQISSGTTYQHLTNFTFANTSATRIVTFPDATGTILLSDANSNVSANNFISGYATTVTAAGNTTLVVGSPYQQFFTGSTTQSVIMAVTSTLTVGQSWLIVNNSSGVVTVKSSGSNNIIAMAGGTNSIITCIAQAGTTAADWNAENLSGVAGVDSITGTANQVIASSPTGTVTLSLPQSIATTSAVTFGSLAFSPTTQGIVGTATNDDAAAGYVGEFVSSLITNGSPVSLTSTSSADVTSISLGAGDWDVWGNVYVVSTVTATQAGCWVSSTSATIPDISLVNNLIGTFTQIGQSVPQLRFSLATTTTIYLSANAVFSGTGTARGGIYARRVR